MSTDYYPDNTVPKAGDRVEVLREPTEQEKKVWNYFRPWMTKTIGEVGNVTESCVISKIPTAFVKVVSGEEWSYPPFLLKVVK